MIDLWKIKSFVYSTILNVQGRRMAGYSDTAVDYAIQPGISLNHRPRYAYQSAKTPLKVPQWTPATAPYHVAPGSGDGPAPWRGQHVYTPKSNCSQCIQPTPTSSSTTVASSTCHARTFWRKITETLTTCSDQVCAPTCLSLATALPQTIVEAMCVRTIQTTYTTELLEQPVSTPPPTDAPTGFAVPGGVFSEPGLIGDRNALVRRRRKVDVETLVDCSVATSPCDIITIQTPALGSGVTLSSDGNPCYSITVTPTVTQKDTCTLDVQVTSYGIGVGTMENGVPTLATVVVDPVTSSGTTCTL
ncbi:uncharacterized protein LOC129584730 isoform X2 [Paramacrobiotus metropolitanus]|uniref:uncharacterized protein LOC129584730 isoform X2 n=1 Tax=Paramacrobiotus metropolitanus TaxID=2943436 RepID=UPI0024461665|nr:uncharacterized protein LOC129584730 isoform X2 [Paramacrobiotus metropolitanus]